LFSTLTSIAAVFSILLIFFMSYSNPDTYGANMTFFQISIAMVIVWASTNSNRASRLVFDNRFLAWTGRISYALYLWHFLSFEISRQLMKSLFPQVLVGIGLSFVMAALSYYLVELRFLRLKSRFGPLLAS
jgi:peptidoglycan/LPS O-acetylase OafA/YrhL